MQWRKLDHMRTICTSLQTDTHNNTSLLNFLTGLMLFLTPNQPCQTLKAFNSTQLHFQINNEVIVRATISDICLTSLDVKAEIQH